MDQDALLRLLRRARNGDQQAAAEILREFEPALLRKARQLVADWKLLCPLVTAPDICQSVFKVFFDKLCSGRYVLTDPGQVVRLLRKIALNRVRYHYREHTAEKRDRRRDVADGEQALAALVRVGDPVSVVANRELLARILGRLDPALREIVALRAEGRPWEEIAVARGRRPDAVRKQFDRAIDRALAELGLEDEDDG